MTAILPLTKNTAPRTKQYGTDPLPAGYVTANGLIIVRPCEWRSYSVKEMRWWEARFVKTDSMVATTPMWCESLDLLTRLLDSPHIVANKFVQVAQRTHQTACGTFEISQNYFDKKWEMVLVRNEMTCEGKATWVFAQPAWKDLEAWVAFHQISDKRNTRRECIARLQQAVAMDPPDAILKQLQDEYFKAHRKQRLKK